VTASRLGVSMDTSQASFSHQRLQPDLLSALRSDTPTQVSERDGSWLVPSRLHLGPTTVSSRLGVVRVDLPGNQDSGEKVGAGLAGKGHLGRLR
jgi:hypothetical protein